MRMHRSSVIILDAKVTGLGDFRVQDESRSLPLGFARDIPSPTRVGFPGRPPPKLSVVSASRAVWVNDRCER